MELSEDIDKRILPRLARFFLVPADLEREAVNERLVPPHKLREGSLVAFLRSFDQLFIGQVRGHMGW